MKLFDKAWWTGTDCIAVAGRLGGLWRMLRLRKTGDLIAVESAESRDTAAALTKVLENAEHARLPVVWVPERESIAEKIIGKAEGEDAVRAVLGVAVEQPDNFAVELFPAYKGRFLASIIRKDKLAELRTEMGTAGKRIVDVSLSGGAMIPVLAGLPDLGSEPGFELKTEAGSFWVKEGMPALREEVANGTFGTIESTRIAEKLGIAPEYLRLYAAGVAHWTRPPGYAAPEAATAAAFRDHTATFRLQRIASVAAAFVVATSLLLAAFRGYLSMQKDDLQSLYAQNLPKINRIETMRTQIESRETLRQTFAGKTLKASRVTWYFDQIAALVPPEISLERLTYAPTEADWKIARAAPGENFNLILRGKAAASSPIARLSANLEAQEFVKEIRVETSEYNYQQAAFSFTFLLEVRHAG